ncbi:MAG: replicative DNA helicase, partial [Desulfobulbaceae bacterium]|nr:replicative DNA helicase [Desulfobulbaceae bacterium]
MEPGGNNSRSSQRVPPQNLDAEQCVLGSILLHQDALSKVIESISAEDFYRNDHRVIFEAMLSLFDKNHP